MNLRDYTYSCLKFAHDTKEWHTLNSGQYYTTYNIGGWKETPDNAHCGVRVSWAFHLNDKFIKENSQRIYLNIFKEELTTLLEDKVSYENIIEFIKER